MKIAIISFYSGQMERGVERWVDEIAGRLSNNQKVIVYQNKKEIKKNSYKILAKNINFDESLKDRKLTSRFDLNIVKRFFLDYHSRKVAEFTIKILPELWRERFDIVIPTDGGWQVALARIVTWLREGKMVAVGHSGQGWDDRNNLWSFPNVFVALSKPAARWAKKVNPFVKNVVYIPNGIDLEFFNPRGKKARIELERPIILTVGAPEKGKRLSLAIDAVSKLGKGSLLILGSKYEEKKIKSFGDELLGKRFSMKSVSYKKIPDYYRAADLFTLPSWGREAFGLVYLEAMASGLPVVATRDESRQEIVGSAGILVDPTDVDAYAKALDKALTTNWRDKPRRQAEKFSWDKITKQYEDLFERLVK